MDEIKEKLSKPKACPLANKKLSEKEIKEQNKTQKRGIIFIILLILIFILVTFLFSFVFSNNDANNKTYTYNGYEFFYNNTVWNTQKLINNNLFLIKLNYGPKQLEDINVIGDVKAFIDKHEFFYITSDPRDENHDAYVTLSIQEVTTNLRLHFGKNFSAAFIMEHEITQNNNNISVINCDNTDSAVIFFNRTNEKKGIEIIDNCAILSGIGEDLLMVADRFLYGMYGIMD
ncbi:MAG: hypothetical protein ACLFPJ_02785 [Candidatus Woesearchaeota archaeon]